MTVTAETDAVLLEIPRATFLRVIAEYPESAAHARRLAFGRLRKLVEELDVVRIHFDAIAADSEAAMDAIHSGALWPDIAPTNIQGASCSRSQGTSASVISLLAPR